MINVAMFQIAHFDRAIFISVKKANPNDTKNKCNPLADGLIIPISEVTEMNTFYVDKEGIFHPQTYEIEKQEHTKIFHAPGVKEKIYNLSEKATKLLMFIILAIEPGQDQIKINAVYYMRKNNVKEATYYRALSELTRYGFIAKDSEGLFWINPEIFFNGKRANKYPENKSIK